jgi:hypothetical protein
MADRCSDFCPVSELRKTCDNLPEVTQCDLRIFRSSEFSTLASRIDQMRFLREQSHKFTANILSTLFSSPQTTVRERLKRQEPLTEEFHPQTEELNEFSGPNAYLTRPEERAVLDWADTKRRAGNSLHLATFATMRVICFGNDLEKTAHWGSPRGGAPEGRTRRTFG